MSVHNISYTQPKMKPEIMKVKEESFVFSCDWLGQSVRFEALPDPNTVMVPEGYQLKQLDGTNVWSSRLYLLNQYGNKVATILSDPKSSVIEHKAGLIELENEWLYHGIGVEGALDLVSSIFPFAATGLSRVDVCCDFVRGGEIFKERLLTLH